VDPLLIAALFAAAGLLGVGLPSVLLADEGLPAPCLPLLLLPNSARSGAGAGLGAVAAAVPAEPA